ncbi:MAG TPA: ABC transporter permease [Chloroflexia bacterium]|jgi:lipopolysaccharide transport system permease protein
MTIIQTNVEQQPIRKDTVLPARQPTVVIRPTRGWAALNLRELWQYRDLLLILAGRDVKLRYKQTALGVVWVVLQPLIAALIFAVIFGRFANLPSDGLPYLLFVFCGLLPWNYFSGALQRAGNSLITDARLISKVYFPRLLIPLASTIAVLIDFAVTLGVLVILMVIYQVMPTWRLLSLPFFLVMTTLMATGVSLWLSALNVKYRDFVYVTPFLIQVWMFASPVVYAATIVPQEWRALYSLNPAVGFIEGFRWALLGGSGLGVDMVLSMAVFALLIFISGAFFFRRVERGFADVV